MKDHFCLGEMLILGYYVSFNLLNLMSYCIIIRLFSILTLIYSNRYLINH